MPELLNFWVTSDVKGKLQYFYRFGDREGQIWSGVGDK